MQLTYGQRTATVSRNSQTRKPEWLITFESVRPYEPSDCQKCKGLVIHTKCQQGCGASGSVTQGCWAHTLPGAPTVAASGKWGARPSSRPAVLLRAAPCVHKEPARENDRCFAITEETAKNVHLQDDGNCLKRAMSIQ